jgi:hypothetical protein
MAMLFGALGGMLSAALLLWIVIGNPFFIDNLGIALLLFVVAPVIAMAVVGLIVGGVAALVTRGRAGAGPATARRWLLVGTIAVLAVTFVGRGVAAFSCRPGASTGLKAALIGVDGATWKVIRPMLAAGEMPNLASLIEDGSSGVLMSSSPMYSPRIFTTIATGKVADKHGVQGASDTTTDAVLVKRVWDILWEQNQWDYGLLEWYVTAPPEASPAGFNIPGPPTATVETEPADLQFLREIEQNAGGMQGGPVGLMNLALTAARRGATVTRLTELAGVATLKVRGASKLEVYRAQHETIVKLATDVALWQMRRSDIQMLAGVYRSTDRLSHAYWRYHEPEAFSGTSPADLEEYGTTIEDIYATVDEQLGRLRRCVEPDGVMLIVSDHGFQPRLKVHMEPFSFRTETLLRALGVDTSDLSYVNLGYGFYLQPLTTDEADNNARRAELEKLFSSAMVEGVGEPAFLVTNVDEVGTGDDYLEVHASKPLLNAVPDDPRVVVPSGESIRTTEFLTPSELSGAHDFDGVIVACGPQFTAGGDIPEASIFDVTPTLLTALGLPVANDMDGRPLVEAMTAEFLARHPVTAVESYETGERRKKEHANMDEMSEDLKEQLRSIGYIE